MSLTIQTFAWPFCQSGLYHFLPIIDVLSSFKYFPQSKQIISTASSSTEPFILGTLWRVLPWPQTGFLSNAKSEEEKKFIQDHTLLTGQMPEKLNWISKSFGLYRSYQICLGREQWWVCPMGLEVLPASLCPLLRFFIHIKIIIRLPYHCIISYQHWSLWSSFCHIGDHS